MIEPAVAQDGETVGVTTVAGMNVGVGAVLAVAPFVDAADGATVAVAARAGINVGVAATAAVVVATVVGTLVAITVRGTVVEVTDGACASITSGEPRVPSSRSVATATAPAAR